MQISVCFRPTPDVQPIEFHVSTSLHELFVGCVSAIALVPVHDYLDNKICVWMTQMKFNISPLQDAVALWKLIQGIASPVLRVATKASFLFYVVILGPIIEEVFMRGFFNGWLKNKFIEKGYDLNEPMTKALYLAIGGMCFGAIHLSSLQGWTNVPIFIMTSLSGVWLSILKNEETNSLTASCWNHMTHNAIAVACFITKK